MQPSLCSELLDLTTAREQHQHHREEQLKGTATRSEDVGQICVLADVEGGAVSVLSDGGA